MCGEPFRLFLQQQSYSCVCVGYVLLYIEYTPYIINTTTSAVRPKIRTTISTAAVTPVLRGQYGEHSVNSCSSFHHNAATNILGITRVYDRRPPANRLANISMIFGYTRGQHSGAREASISPIFGVSRPSVHFSARFFLVGLPLARLTGPPPGAASAVPASSRGGVRKVRNADPIP